MDLAPALQELSELVATTICIGKDLARTATTLTEIEAAQRYLDQAQGMLTALDLMLRWAKS